MKRAITLLIMMLIISLPIVFAAEISRTYDANGNLIRNSDEDFYRVYNSLNQLSEIRNYTNDNLIQEYTYDLTEERVAIKKTYDNTESLIESVYYVDETDLRVVNSSGTYDTTYVHQNGELVAEIDDSGYKRFHHSDHLGSSSVVSDESGTVLENTSYSPYGEVLSGGSSRYDYEGKELDDYSGYDFEFRTYNPELGLFNRPDTLIPNVYDPQSLNRYMFERGNPYKYTDPTGHLWGSFVQIYGDTQSSSNLAKESDPNVQQNMGEGILVGAVASATAMVGGTLIYGTAWATGPVGGLAISVIGLAAAGLHTYAKNKEYYELLERCGVDCLSIRKSLFSLLSGVTPVPDTELFGMDSMYSDLSGGFNPTSITTGSLGIIGMNSDGTPVFRKDSSGNTQTDAEFWEDYMNGGGGGGSGGGTNPDIETIDEMKERHGLT